MTAAGIDPLMEVDHGWCHSLYYLDPNGIMVELCRDTPGFEPDPEAVRELFSASEKPRRRGPTADPRSLRRVGGMPLAPSAAGRRRAPGAR